MGKKKKKIKNKLDEECLNYIKRECGKWKVYKIKETKNLGKVSIVVGISWEWLTDLLRWFVRLLEISDLDWLMFYAA